MTIISIKDVGKGLNSDLSAEELGPGIGQTLRMCVLQMAMPRDSTACLQCSRAV